MSERSIEPINFEDADITVLTPKQQRFFTLYISGRYTNMEIAELLGVHHNTITNWLSKEEVSGMIDAYQKKEYEHNHQRLKALSNEAIKTMAELLDSPIDGIRYQASKDILDRTNFKPVDKKEVKTEVFNYEQTMQKMIDATVTEEDVIELIEHEDYEVEYDE